MKTKTGELREKKKRKQKRGRKKKKKRKEEDIEQMPAREAESAEVNLSFFKRFILHSSKEWSLIHSQRTITRRSISIRTRAP